MRRRPTPVPGTAAVRRSPAGEPLHPLSRGFGGFTLSSRHPVRWPGGQYLTRSGHRGAKAASGSVPRGGANAKWRPLRARGLNEPRRQPAAAVPGSCLARGNRRKLSPDTVTDSQHIVVEVRGRPQSAVAYCRCSVVQRLLRHQKNENGALHDGENLAVAEAGRRDTGRGYCFSCAWFIWCFHDPTRKFCNGHVSWTHLATEGTPAVLTTNSM